MGRGGGRCLACWKKTRQKKGPGSRLNVCVFGLKHVREQINRRMWGRVVMRGED